MKEEKKIFLKEQGERIREARWKQKLTQVELAKIVGYSDSTTIFKMEKGLQDVPLDKEERLCQALGISSDHLRGVTVDKENITISVKDVKGKMKGWYDKYFEGEDESYSELFAALRTLRNAGLISEEDWKDIYEYDHILFQETCGIVPQ